MLPRKATATFVLTSGLVGTFALYFLLAEREPVAARPAEDIAAGHVEESGPDGAASAGLSELRKDLARLQAAHRRLRDTVRQQGESTPEGLIPVDQPPPEQRTTAEDSKAEVALRETSFRKALSAEVRDSSWEQELTGALATGIAKLPGVLLESADCGSSVCIAEVRHDATQSAADLWNSMGADPTFSGPVLLASHADGAAIRTSIYVGRAETDLDRASE